MNATVPKVYAAIAAVSAELATTGISKDRKNEQQGYKFRGIDDVYNAIAPLMAKHKLVILPRMLSREQTVADPIVMHRSMTAVHAANICMWLGRDLKFDPVKEEFLNDDEANRFRSRAMREPWII